MLDGAGCHRSNLVKGAAFIFNFKLHYLPLYNPNHNLIGQLWKATDSQLRSKIYFKSKRCSKKAIT
ncbi:transposase [Candidatus Enterovibrio altilux]|uniref:transposase n=1 Tax=Candidatus Enterovibrio altilux TaxID=1927128 RepID=UPI0012382799